MDYNGNKSPYLLINIKFSKNSKKKRGLSNYIENIISSLKATGGVF